MAHAEHGLTVRTIRRPGLLVADVVGLGLAAAFALAAFVGPGDPDAELALAALVALVVAMVVVARLVGQIHRVLPAVVIVAAALLVAVMWRGELVGGGPGSGPFGYRNATGAFFSQVVFAAATIAVAAPWRILRIFGTVAAAGAAIIALNDSVAAGLVLVLALVALMAWSPRMARAAVAVSLGAMLLTVSATVVLGRTIEPGAPIPVLLRGLTERRLTLWHEATEIMGSDPRGVGTGRFRDVSATARDDPDAVAAHNEFLQAGVELGWVGFFLLIGMFVWAEVRLLLLRGRGRATALAGAAIGALGILASVDYVLRFPAIPLVGAALLGAALASRETAGGPR